MEHKGKLIQSETDSCIYFVPMDEFERYSRLEHDLMCDSQDIELQEEYQSFLEDVCFKIDSSTITTNLIVTKIK